ncbi:MAG: serine hydrolase domain-containing protein, partial [Pseudonocardia sediminis]
PDGTASGGTASDDSGPRPVDPDRTLFRVGSVSKVFTATAVLQLVEQGRIDLDADVGRYLDFPLPRSFDAPITMRNLLTHTAGFEERIKGLIAYGESPVNLRDDVAVDPPEQVFAPGTVPAYSNYGYALAGYIAERVSGTPFETLVQRDVLARAGMTSSTFAQPLPPELRDRLSRGYDTASNPAGPFETVGPAPAGALSATATDMARFLQTELGGAGRPPLLTPETLALMRTPALDASTLGTLADGPRMALGLFDESRNGHRIVGHGGDTGYFHAHLQMYPDDRTGVFVALNSTGRGPTDTLELRESLLDGFADRYFPAASAPQAATSPTAAEHAAMAQGSYEASRSLHSTFLSAMGVTGQTTVIARPDGTVLVAPGPGTAYPAVYREVRPWVWQEVGGQRILTMRADGDRVTAIGYQSAFTLLRAEPGRAAGVALPVLLSSAAVLLVALLAWPVGALNRRRHRLPAPASLGRLGDLARLLTRVATAAAVLALAGWTTAIATIAGLQEFPDVVVRVLQVAQWTALAGVAPAAVLLIASVRRRAGRGRVLGAVLVLLALIGIAWFGTMFGLFSTSVSY